MKTYYRQLKRGCIPDVLSAAVLLGQRLTTIILLDVRSPSTIVNGRARSIGVFDEERFARWLRCFGCLRAVFTVANSGDESTEIDNEFHLTAVRHFYRRNFTGLGLAHEFFPLFLFTSSTDRLIYCPPLSPSACPALVSVSRAIGPRSVHKLLLPSLPFSPAQIKHAASLSLRSFRKYFHRRIPRENRTS